MTLEKLHDRCDESVDSVFPSLHNESRVLGERRRNLYMDPITARATIVLGVPFFPAWLAVTVAAETASVCAPDVLMDLFDAEGDVVVGEPVTDLGDYFLLGLFVASVKSASCAVN